ncbi:hypothetical protein H0H81_004400 [Sphagnurus paluster]|uniref:Uncharacterized protein n=1 Tax=Sphagnurus paluster TaxID=117069 RepID=A0A9P7KGB0_9AGAR|nr:hypothetical protein H0H81_004400 [Sphagnurus paluster]
MPNPALPSNGAKEPSSAAVLDDDASAHAPSPAPPTFDMPNLPPHAAEKPVLISSMTKATLTRV